MTKKYSVKEDKNLCYELSYFKDYLIEHDLNEIELEEMEATFNSGLFYCKIHQEVGETGEVCGNQCSTYSPRNKISGRCRHSDYVYDPTGKTKTLKR